MLTDRIDVMKRLVGDYKYGPIRGIEQILVDILDMGLPALPDDVIVTSLPTIRPHIRERGFDHALNVAKGFARRRGHRYEQVLRRTEDSVQQGSNKKQRQEQARRAFKARKKLTGTYVVIDDVLTTGASLRFGAKCLRSAGANDVWIVAVTRQPLD